MKTSGKGLAYSYNHIQDVDSIMCGYYVCYFILERAKRWPVRDILSGGFAPPPLRGSTLALGGGPGALPQKNLKFKVAKALEN